jgi:hypothetical protein
MMAILATRRFLVPLSAALLAALSGAGGSGFLIPEAAAQVARRPDDEDDPDAPLVLAVADAPPSEMLAHRSHSSHSSHRSHVSGSGGGGYGGGGGGYASPDPPAPAPVYVPPPPPPKPAAVSLVAYPGGRIFVDGNLVGTDATGTLYLKPEGHEIRVANRFVGEHTRTIYLTDGQTGAVTIEW